MFDWVRVKMVSFQIIQNVLNVRGNMAEFNRVQNIFIEMNFQASFMLKLPIS